MKLTSGKSGSIFVGVVQSPDIVHLSVHVLRTHISISHVAVVVLDALRQEVHVLVSAVLDLFGWCDVINSGCEL